MDIVEACVGLQACVRIPRVWCMEVRKAIAEVQISTLDYICMFVALCIHVCLRFTKIRELLTKYIYIPTYIIHIHTYIDYIRTYITYIHTSLRQSVNLDWGFLAMVAKRFWAAKNNKFILIVHNDKYNVYYDFNYCC